MILEGIAFKSKHPNSMAGFLLWDLPSHAIKASVAPLNDLTSSSFHASSGSHHVLRADRRVNTPRCSLPLSLTPFLSRSFLPFIPLIPVQRTCGGVPLEVYPELTPSVVGARGTGKTRVAGGLVIAPRAGLEPGLCALPQKGWAMLNVMFRSMSDFTFSLNVVLAGFYPLKWQDQILVFQFYWHQEHLYLAAIMTFYPWLIADYCKLASPFKKKQKNKIFLVHNFYLVCYFFLNLQYRFLSHLAFFSQGPVTFWHHPHQLSLMG